MLKSRHLGYGGAEQLAEHVGVAPVVLALALVVNLTLLGRAPSDSHGKQRVTLREVLVRAGDDTSDDFRCDDVEGERIEPSAARRCTSRGAAVRRETKMLVSWTDRKATTDTPHPAWPNWSGDVSGAVIPCAAQESWAISHKCKSPVGSSAKSRQQRRSATTLSKERESWPRISGGGR